MSPYTHSLSAQERRANQTTSLRDTYGRVGVGRWRHATDYYLLTYLLTCSKVCVVGVGVGGSCCFCKDKTRRDVCCCLCARLCVACGKGTDDACMHICVYESLKVLLFSMCGLAGTFGAPSRKSSERSVFCCRFLVSSEERTARIINSEPRHSLLCQCGCSMVCVYYICLLRGMDGPKNNNKK